MHSVILIFSRKKIISLIVLFSQTDSEGGDASRTSVSVADRRTSYRRCIYAGRS